MSSRWLLLGAMLALGCGDDGGEAEVGADWSARSLEPTTQKIGGMTVRISLPEGLTRDTEEPGRVHWVADVDDYFSEPQVTLTTVATPPDSVERAVEYAMPGDEEKIARDEAIERGYIVTTHAPDRGLVQVHVWKTFGDQTISCASSQAKTGGVPNFEATRDWLQQICLSLRPE